MNEDKDPRDMDPLEAIRWHLFLAQCELNAIGEVLKALKNERT